MLHLLPRIRDIRRFGSCALDLCGVAQGSLDGYLEEGVNLWDHAAGGLIATSAGARVETDRGVAGGRSSSPLRQTVSTSSGLRSPRLGTSRLELVNPLLSGEQPPVTGCSTPASSAGVTVPGPMVHNPPLPTTFQSVLGQTDVRNGRRE